MVNPMAPPSHCVCNMHTVYKEDPATTLGFVILEKRRKKINYNKNILEHILLDPIGTINLTAFK